MLNNSDFEISGSLNDAFELIKSIFDKERKSYEKTILSMKNRITELEEALIKANKENMKYQTKISNLKRKLTSISKTVSKLEDSDFDLKNEKKETEKNDFITNRENCHNNIKYRNKEKMNSFRKKTKFMSNINRSASDNCNQFMKTNFVDINNTKQLNNGEDIKTNYNITNKTNRPNKKTLSSKIKNSLLNNIEQTAEKIGHKKNNLFKSYAHNGENHSLYLHSNGYSDKNKNTKLIENYVKRNDINKVKYLSSDKYNQIEQKIKGIKSNLTMFKEKEENKLNASLNDNSISINEENIFPQD